MQQRILVLGAGYAGLLAALRLATHHDVTLVDANDHFTERVRAHELAAGRPAIEHPLRPMLSGTGITQITGRVTAVDPTARTVHTDNGHELGYDRLVYALGSHTDTRGGVLGSGDRAYTTETAAELRKRLLDGPGTLAVVGGGLTGIELSAELAEAYPDWRVRLLTAGQIGAGLSEPGRAHVRATLGGMGVRVEEGRVVASADAVDADVVVWAAAMAPATDLLVAAGVAVDATGRAQVDATLRSVSHPELYVVGDAAGAGTAESGPLRMACATAIPSGAQAAAALLAESRGLAPRPLRFRYLVQCISLGRHDGLIQFVRADDSPRRQVLTGRTAALVKEQVVRYTVRTMRLAARRPDLLRLLPGLG
jgi:NADH dehydrogenase